MESKEEQQTVEAEVQSQSAGQLLQEARLKQGLTLEQVAEKINLRVTHIKDIEEDNIDPAVSLTFTRGYVKLYARLVSIDEATILKALDKNAQVAKREPAKLQSFSKKVAKQASDDKLMAVTYFIIFSIVALFIIWAVQQKGISLPLISGQTETVTPEAEVSASTPSTSVVPANNQKLDTANGSAVNDSVADETTGLPAQATSVNASEEPVLDTLDNDQETELPVTASSEPVDNNTTQLAQFTNPDTTDNADAIVDSTLQTGETIVDEADANSITLQSTPQENTDVGQLQVDESQALTADDQAILALAPGVVAETDLVDMIFTFSEECWVNVTDATGENIAVGVKQSGYVMTVSGVPPIEVVLGAPSVVAIDYDGQTVDMSRFPAGRTARFELPILN